ncbi:hypothetical protein DSN97_01010 [Deferribacteraceae bacterium V6Fe1]|nr:hypothetical protein DSN97_01010 [Deferribacteraceae bacterium V6Fe1]
MVKNIPKLSTTSFIYRDTRIMNVLKLKHLFDEIELLYFESRRKYDQLDDNELMLLNKMDMKYVVHLPYDRDLSRIEDFKFMESFISKLDSPKISYYFLHSIGNDYDAIERLCHLYPSVLVENTTSSNIFYDLKYTKINYCLDVGHALLSNENPINIIKKYKEKIKYIHLHGVHDGRDHKEITYLDVNLLKFLFDFAIDFNVGISLELFGLTPLINSLNYLSEVFKRYGYAYHGWN